MVRLFIFSVSVLFCTSAGEKLRQVTAPLYHVEGPHWDVEKQVLYYVDISNGLVNKYDPKTEALSQVHIGGNVSPVLTVQGAGDQFVVGRNRDLVSFRWNGENGTEATDCRVMATVDEDNPGNIFNDGKADSEGRIWAGTIENDGQTNGASFNLFSSEDGFKPHKKFSATISNGLAWNADDTLLYYIDSQTRKIDVFDYDKKTGEINNRKTIFDFKKNELTGDPDGMTIDSDGNLWVAVWGGSNVLHIDPSTGTVHHRVEINATQVSSCTFGGENLDVLYITTSRAGLSDEDLVNQPLAGAVFALSESGYKGVDKNVKVRLPDSSGSPLPGCPDFRQ